eukprot:TRINITY_DN453_c0_g2_i2.p1 TRINITY_DN453_c0_g2~~TRINITY_DN453_c0_g2_i2.p1  ORF type:complete len:422 (+),score=21.04 TRINITY_DN453_c0_g2_i2:26-1267(+)
MQGLASSVFTPFNNSISFPSKRGNHSPTTILTRQPFKTHRQRAVTDIKVYSALRNQNIWNTKPTISEIYSQQISYLAAPVVCDNELDNDVIIDQGKYGTTSSMQSNNLVRDAKGYNIETLALAASLVTKRQNKVNKSEDEIPILKYGKTNGIEVGQLLYPKLIVANQNVNSLMANIRCQRILQGSTNVIRSIGFQGSALLLMQEVNLPFFEKGKLFKNIKTYGYEPLAASLVAKRKNEKRRCEAGVVVAQENSTKNQFIKTVGCDTQQENEILAGRFCAITIRVHQVVRIGDLQFYNPDLYKDIHIVNIYNYTKRNSRQQKDFRRELHVTLSDKYENDSLVMVCGDINQDLRKDDFFGLVDVHKSHDPVLDYQFVSPKLLPAVEKVVKVKKPQVKGVKLDHPMLIAQLNPTKL